MNFASRHVLLVCQQPFTSQSESPTGGTQSYSFCKLVPLMTAPGDRARRNDFKNDGEVWWMLLNHTRPLAKPGILVTADLQDATNPDRTSPTDSLIQADRESVRKMGPETGYSVVTLEDFTGTKLEHLVDPSFRCVLTYQPTDAAFVRCLGRVVGPLKVNSEEHPQGWQVRFQTNATKTALNVPERDFGILVGGANLLGFNEKISLSQAHRMEVGNLRTVKMEILLAAGYNKLLESRPESILLESTGEKLSRVSSKLGATRAKRQQLRALLDELEPTAASVEVGIDAQGLIEEVRANLDAYESSLNEITEALLQSGVFGEDRIRKAEERFGQQYVESRRASLDSEIQKQISQLQIAKQDLERSVQFLRQQENDLKKKAQDIANKTLREERLKLETEFQEREKKLESELTALLSLQETIQSSLSEVTAEMREHGDAIVTRFLSIAPLLGLNQSAVSSRQSRDSPLLAPQAGGGMVSRFEFAAHLSLLPSGPPLKSEQEFVQRFESLVEESGLSYRSIDLRRFHISAKTGSFIVLGGPSGTGKSTLPQLYGRALLGDVFDEAVGSIDCLMVSVSPGWMDSKDIMGYVNSIDKRFHPSETGLYLELLKAEYEHQSKEDSAPVRLICLDEMNLAQTEHYFGEVMTVLEREGMQRRVKIFSEEACGPDCPFRMHGTIKLSPGLRFIGTVNFDETTRLLSDRLLDRTNLIELQSSDLPSLAGWNPSARATGPAVTISDFSNWTSHDALPQNLAGILDRLRPQLTALGCAISPRTYRGLCAFVASSKGLVSEGEAFDVQLAQRVLSRLRHVHNRAQMDALDNIAKIAEESAESQFEETLRLVEIRRSAALAREWDLD